MTMLKATDISRKFPVGEGEEFWALKHISLTIPKGKLTILRGRSGSGKTTLLNILSGLDQPSEGQIYMEDTCISDLSEAQRDKWRREKIGYVYQSVALIPMMSAYENVEFSLRLSRTLPQESWEKRTEECLHLVGLGNRMTHMPQEMSGGEQQRVAIARAVAHKPLLLFADEPTAELDTNTGLQVVKIFKELCEKEGVTVIMTTHDTGLMDIGDQVYELEDGEVVRQEET